jgi:2-iminoacetate synthase
MCLTIPGKIKAIRGQTAIIQQNNNLLNVNVALLNNLKIGDWILYTADFAVKKIDHDEAQEILELLEPAQKIDSSKLSDQYLQRLKRVSVGSYTDQDLLFFLKNTNRLENEALFSEADAIRKSYLKEFVCIHGIIEFSNYCRNYCQYCGIRCGNDNLPRYRMSKKEIVDTAVKAVKNEGYKMLVLQSGEDTNYSAEKIASIVDAIKKQVKVLIFISVGDRDYNFYKKVKEAGAFAVLYRFETSNENLYARIHPGQNLATRLQHLQWFKELGYFVATGFLNGLPGQTAEDLVKDLLFLKALKPEMITVGPFVATPNTPFAQEKDGQVEETFKIIALARLLIKETRIPVVSALETLIPNQAAKLGFLAGANGIMYNLTPAKYKKNYKIYKNKEKIKDDKILKKYGLYTDEQSYEMIERELGVQIWDKKNNPIVDTEKISLLLINDQEPNDFRLEEIINIAKQKKGLELQEVIELLNVNNSDKLDKIFQAAKQIKQEIYGNRLVLFAPLYVSSFCVNNCQYCGFHTDNKAVRKKLTIEEIKEQVRVLENMGHKRLLLEFGEDPIINPIDYVVETIKAIYSVKNKNGEIRRVNVNIAATTIENYKKLKTAGIGTYQLFQETYHLPTYRKLHQGPKADYTRQITAMDRAFAAGIDDLGIGILFGLYDYKFEVLALIAHAQYMENKFGVGPHTISMPRFKSSQSVDFKPEFQVADKDFLKIVAILRLAVPYTGLILSTRETPELRRQAFQIGISQASAASRTEPGSYGKNESNCSQFIIEDHRTLDEVILDICKIGYFPSFCTACYRLGRTGDKFMEYAKTGKIQNFCQPNAIMTFKEYLEDYASFETKKAGEKVIIQELGKIPDKNAQKITLNKLKLIEQGKRDLYF